MAEVARRLEARLDLLGVDPEGVVVNGVDDLVESDVTRGRVLRKNPAAPAFQICGQNLEHVARDLENFFLDIAGRDEGGGTAHDDRARTVVAESPRASLGIALH